VNTNTNKRIAAAVGALAATAAVLVGCSATQDAAKDAASSVTSAAKGAGDAAKDAATKATDAAKDAAGDAKDAAKDAATKATDAAKDTGTNATDAAKDAATKATDAVKGAIDKFDVPGVGEVKLSAPVAEAFSKLGGEARLGLPTAAPETVGDGVAQAFANGTIFSSPGTGAHLVQGEILRVYNEHQGAAGPLGFPTSDEAQTGGGPKAANGGWVGEFQNGSITWLNTGNGTFTGTVTPK